MKSNHDELKIRSALFWFAAVIPLAIIGIGINFILNPVGASTGFGIPMHDPGSFPFMWIKGIRDIFSGLVVLAFLLPGNRKASALLFSIATLIPIADGFVIITRQGFAPPLMIHWGTAAYMAVVSYFLFRQNKVGDAA